MMQKQEPPIHNESASVELDDPTENRVPVLHADQIRDSILQLSEEHEPVRDDPLLDEAGTMMRDLRRLHPDAPR